ncbi:MAG: TolC family protein [Phycisphaerae bacterium]|nr:TolC family protein [Phycisphaerae bacterium]
MNNQSGAGRRDRGRAAWMLAFMAGGLSACSNPLFSDPSDRGPASPKERLRSVGLLKLENYAKPTTPGQDQPPTEPPKDPFAGMERFELSIEQARAWTLKNNLDLQVSLIEPTIAREALSVEEAKFESLFTTRFRYNNIDQPTQSAINNNSAEQFSFAPGVRIPLRTGGTALVELPLNYQQTDAAFSVPESYETDLRLSISQPLLRNAGRETNTHSIRIQALETQIAESRAKLEVIRQLANVDRAYWRLFAAKELLKVRQDQYELAKTQLSQAERRVRAQVAADVEVVRAQSGVAERLDGIIRADNTVRNFQRELKRVMNEAGMEIDSNIVLELSSKPDPVAFDINTAQFADAAVANRMEMLELELRLAQDYSTINFQKNQALPLFTTDFSYTVNGLGTTLGRSVELAKDNRFEDWSVGASLEVPLGNEAAEGRVHQAILRRLQRLSSRDARELAIRQEVYNAVDGINTSWQRILAARQATILAARTLRAEQNQFEVGARTSTDVLDAATRLADAQSSEITALTDYQISQVDLAFATGTLLGAMRVDWEPRDPRTPPDDFVGERRGRTPRGPAGNPAAPLSESDLKNAIENWQPPERPDATGPDPDPATTPPSSSESDAPSGQP